MDGGEGVNTGIHYTQMVKEEEGRWVNNLNYYFSRQRKFLDDGETNNKKKTWFAPEMISRFNKNAPEKKSSSLISETVYYLEFTAFFMV